MKTIIKELFAPVAADILLLSPAMKVRRTLLATSLLTVMASLSAGSYTQFPEGYCTRFAAKKFDENSGVTPSPLCNWSGNAGTWLSTADTNGWVTDRAARSAKVGAIIVWVNGTFGHVGFVTAVSSTGITVQEMNYGPPTGNPADASNGITANFGIVTQVDLPFTQLSRGPLKNGGYKLTFSGYVFPTRKGAEYGVPMYRYYNVVTDQHFYTTNLGELGYGVGPWIYEGARFCLKPTSSNGAVAVRRFLNLINGGHFYTLSTTEANNGFPWRRENDMGFAYNPSGNQPNGTVAIYRYYNPYSDDHFYTTDFRELGGGTSIWIYEGVRATLSQITSLLSKYHIGESH